MYIWRTKNGSAHAQDFPAFISILYIMYRRCIFTPKSYLQLNIFTQSIKAYNEINVLLKLNSITIDMTMREFERTEEVEG